jgi:hypothetical protein
MLLLLDIQPRFSYIQLTQEWDLITLFLDQLGAELLEPISWQQRIEENEWEVAQHRFVDRWITLGSGSGSSIPLDTEEIPDDAR